MEKSTTEDHLQLYFCDSCNTSIPQSHVITGRALARGGKTYCEGCRDRAQRRLSPAIPVIGVLVVAAVLVLLVMNFAPRGSDEASATVTQLDEFQKAYLAKVDEIEAAARDDDAALVRLDESRKSLRGEVGKLVEQVEGLERQATEENRALAGKVAGLQGELARLKPLEAKVARIPALEAEIERLRVELERAKRAGAARPEPTRPGPEPQPEPEPAKPAPDMPEAVRALIERLASPDSGIRFSAAVDLGKAKHPAAVEPLAKLLTDDEDLFVRRGAAKALGEIKDRRAVTGLIEALTDSEIYVSLQAAKSLRVITGKEFGFRENLSMSQRRQIQGKWKKWWKSNSGK